MSAYEIPEGDVPENTLPAERAQKVQRFIQDGLAQMDHYADQAKAESTHRLYQSAWNRYLAFCKFYAINPLSGDPAQIAFYIANCAKHRKDKPGIPYSPNTLNYHIAAIQAAHLEHNIPLNLKHGVFRKVWDGYRRSHSGEVRQATPLLQDHMEILVRLASRPKVDARARANRAARDRALLLLGFCGAFRRSELASLQLEHLSFDHKGLLIKLPRSKTDQEGKGAYLAVYRQDHEELCPATAVARWIDCLSDTEGPLFRRIFRYGTIGAQPLTPAAIYQLVKELVRRAREMSHVPLPFRGEDIFSPHSLRAGFITQASLNEVPLEQSGRHARQKSVATTKRYYRVADAWKANPSEHILDGNS